MKTIVFIGTQKSGSSYEAIRAAQNLGYYTVVLTNSRKQIEQRAEFRDVHLMKLCDIDNFEKMKEIIQNLQAFGLKIKAITSFVDSRCCMANRLAKEFALPYFTIEAIMKMENKIESRIAINNTKYCPRFITLDSNNSYSKDFINNLLPAVLKSPKSAGSKDVYKVEDYDSFTKRLNELYKKFPDLPIILEEYVDGPQYIAEVLVINEVIHIIGIIEQEISYLNNHFIVTGYYLQNEKPEYYDDLYKAVSDIVQLHGMKFGACHLEIRNANGVWKLIEINPRISGGGMNQLIELGTGINLVEQTIKLLLGEKINIEPKYHQYVYAQYTTSDIEGILEKVTGVTKTKELSNILSVYIKPRKGSKISLPLSLGSRYAYIIASGTNKNDAVSNAKNAIKEIQFHIIK
jgi:biotin carboxylase